MELSDLQVFRQVVISGGITRAAEHLNRVPSNVTARIQKLEEEVGKPLFIRDKNRLRISVAGKQLLSYAQRILSLADEALNKVKDQHPAGSLRIGAMEAVAATRLVDPTMKFHQKYPSIDLHIQTAATAYLIDKVLSEELDLAFVADPVAHNDLVITPLYHETLVLVSDKNRKPIKRPSDLCKNPTLLGFSPQCAYRKRLSDWADQENNPPKVIEISSYHTLLSCVAAGMGIGIVPEVLLDHYPFKQHIQSHTLPPKWRKSTSSMIWRKDKASAAIEAFSQSVKESIYSEGSNF